MDGGVRVETEAVRRRDAPCGALRQVEWRLRLKGAQLRAAAEVLSEADGAVGEGALVAEAAGGGALQAPEGVDEAPLEALEEAGLLHDVEAQRHGEPECPLGVGDAGEDRFEVGAGVQRATGGAGVAPAAPFAREGDEARFVAGCSGHLDEAGAHVPAAA
jgi:hypothetical protein